MIKQTIRILVATCFFAFTIAVCVSGITRMLRSYLATDEIVYADESKQPLTPVELGYTNFNQQLFLWFLIMLAASIHFGLTVRDIYGKLSADENKI